MKNLFVWASLGENGKAVGGKKGDQTGKEVRLGNYYNFGQNVVIRFKDKQMGRKMANVSKYFAKSNIVGYDQNTRTSFYHECSFRNWDFRTIKKDIEKGCFPKCNTDCSAFCATCINVVIGRQIMPCFTTHSMEQYTACNYPSLFDSIPITKIAKIGWRKGDMPLKAGKHVIINV